MIKRYYISFLIFWLLWVSVVNQYYQGKINKNLIISPTKEGLESFSVDDLFVPIDPYENGTLPIVIKNGNSSVPDYITSYVELSISSKFAGLSSRSIEPKSTDVVATWVEIPAYWDRGSVITVRVGFKSYLRYSYTATLTITCEIRDKYKYQFFPVYYWKTEASAQKSVRLTLRPRATKYVNIYVDTPTTTVGLKKVIVEIRGDLQYTFDEGYNFVQRFNKNEFGSITKVDYRENDYELSDIYHFNEYTIIKKAGEAADMSYESIKDPYRTAKKMNGWIHNNFEYTNTTNYRHYTWGDKAILSTYDGKYHGVCDEYTVLFVSFVRALNIPARQIYILWSDVNIAHEFAEIWSGDRWVHADPTWNAFDDPQIYKRHGYKQIYMICILQGADDSLCSYDDNPYDNVPDNGVIHYLYDYEYKFMYSNNPYD